MRVTRIWANPTVRILLESCWDANGANPIIAMTMHTSLLSVVATVSLALTLGAQQKAPYLDESLTFEQRVRDLVSRMTLEEKVMQMKDVAPAIPRLGVPQYNWWNEALHGVARAGLAT